ncbi:Sporulation kinase E [Zhongshania aliphaticivorans]|uniref:histidine kinase n=1 Tax=Zhongshania aliphaticivorans TaxID=1470434 RepID=A0A5S9NB72_9GAMM|nr:CHASE domain-containing protein [Zhongshania aliphaticivorans]CAA0087041.1 Sporulation kinase E [Zhongshania aliphaticivorans]CAA0113961.1 Sporulation kinase E [Zhongshania aliphaticivorans]
MTARVIPMIFLLAMSYFVLGKTALLLAIPPGYATAIWPSAGIALAAIMLKGYRLWPGVLLGSFLVNVYALPDFSQPLLDLVSSFVVPLVIGAGAALQAVVGTWLVRRYIGYQLRLDSVSEVLRFIVFACGLSCVVSASVGTITLLVTGIVSAENFIFHWLTWWVGDGLGVMIATILAFVYFGQPEDVWRSRRRILPMILIGVSLIVMSLFFLGSRWELSRQQDEFHSYSDETLSRAQVIVDTYIENLYALRALMEVSDHVSAAEFKFFVGGFLERNSGFQAVTWTPLVRDVDRADLELEMSAENGRDVHITRRDQSNKLLPQSKQSEYMMVRYIEPLQGNVAALGYDISSNSFARAAFTRAVMSGRPEGTDVIRLIQEQEAGYGFVVYLAVKSTDPSVKSDSLRGFVSGVFRIPDLMAVLLPPAYLGDITATVSTERGGVIYSTQKDTSDSRVFAGNGVLHFGGVDFLIELEAGQRFLAGSRSITPWGMLVAGLLFTGLLGMTFLVLTGQKHSSEMAGQELKAMLAQLRETQDHLVESEKMASLGGLVAGFAHELNTPLGIAITAESTLQDDIAKLTASLESSANMETSSVLARMREASQIVLANVQRAGGLIVSFKQVSVDQATTETRSINLYEYLTDVLMHLSPNYRRSGHEVVLDCPADISIRTVPGGIAQVVINLLNNSLIHAFPHSEKGHIHLSVTRQQDNVVIRFSDDGIGISELNQKKVFEPFYTTRRGSGGTGLGLHVVYNIVNRQLKGRISIVNQAVSGTSFEIVLPMAINQLDEHAGSIS